MRGHFRKVLHTVAASVEPQATARVTRDGDVHPHAYILGALLQCMVSTPVPSFLTAESYSLAASLLTESCNGRCGGSVEAFSATLTALLAMIRSLPIVESRTSTVVDRVLAGTLELTRVLVRR